MLDTGHALAASLLAVTLAASPWPSARAAAPTAAADLPDHYAPLFEPGRTWRWTIGTTTTTHDYDPDTDETTTETQTAQRQTRCTVGEVAARSGALTALVTCDPELGAEAPRLAGLWVATRKGAWHLPGAEAAGFEGIRKAHGKPLLTPKQKARSWRLDESCALAVASSRLTVYGGLDTRGWCLTETCEPPQGGDAVWNTTCFAPEVGALSCRYETSHGAFDVESLGAALDPLPEAAIAWSAAPEGQAAAVAKVVRGWVAAQNGRDFDAYSAAYDAAFEGIKRTSGGRTSTYTRAAWLKDRRRMFDGGGQQVVARDARLVLDGDRATVTFTQLWRSPTYADRGTKELQLTRQPGGTWRLSREEMKTSERWHGQLSR